MCSLPHERDLRTFIALANAKESGLEGGQGYIFPQAQNPEHTSYDLPSENRWLPPACALFLQRGLIELNLYTNAFCF